MIKHPAFPSQHVSSEGRPYEPDGGMTLLDYFAAKAMVALVPLFYTNEGESEETTAKRAYMIAQAMMARKEQIES